MRSRAEVLAYQRQWRKDNPHNSRDHMRRVRGSRIQARGRWKGRVMILGVTVTPEVYKLERKT